jgi:hypothetical protein
VVDVHVDLDSARLMPETATVMIAAWSADRIVVQLSPSSHVYRMYDSDDRATFGHVIRELDAVRD